MVRPRHCWPVGPAQWSSVPVAAGGGAVVDVGGGVFGAVRVHTWYWSGPHYYPTQQSVEKQDRDRGRRTRMVPGAQPPKPQPPPLKDTQLAPPYKARWLSPVNTQFCCATPGKHVHSFTGHGTGMYQCPESRAGREREKVDVRSLNPNPESTQKFVPLNLTTPGIVGSKSKFKYAGSDPAGRVQGMLYSATPFAGACVVPKHYEEGR